MTTQTEQPASKGLDWPLIGFFVLAYAIAWGALAILGVIARQSGIDSALTLLEIPGLVGTDWELVSTLGLLVVGIIAGIVVWRQGRGEPHD